MALQVAVAIIANVLITFSAQALIVAVVAGRFFVFNPNLMEGMGISPSGEYHAIVITRHEGSVMEYFDPQNRTYGQITQEQLDDYTARNGKSSFFSSWKKFIDSVLF